MAFRFMRRITILPGVRVNLSKSGASLSLGPRGASVNIGKRGVYGNVGLPGTGMSYRTRLDTPNREGSRSRAHPQPKPAVVAYELTPDEFYVERLSGLLRDREQGDVDWSARADLSQWSPAPDPDDDAFDSYARALGQARFARRMTDGDRAAWSEVLYTELSNEDLPFPFSFDFGVDDESDLIRIDIELPGLEVVPSQASRRRRDGTLAYRDLPKKIVRELYEDVCCALVLRVAHEVYRTIPDANDVHVTGHRLELMPSTGRAGRATYLRFATDRESFSYLNLDMVDPSDAFEYLGGASTKSRSMLVPLSVEPLPDPSAPS